MLKTYSFSISTHDVLMDLVVSSFLLKILDAKSIHKVKTYTPTLFFFTSVKMLGNNFPFLKINYEVMGLAFLGML